MKRKGANVILLVLLAAALALSVAAILSCKVKDDSPANVLPTGLGEDVYDPDPPDIDPTATLVIVPGDVSFAVPPYYGGGDYFYFYARGGKTPYIWSQSTPRIGRIVLIDEYGNGITSKIKYIIKGFSGKGDDIILLTDGTGNTVTRKISVTELSTDSLAINPASVTISNATGGERVIFSAMGGMPPYTWTHSMTSAYATIRPINNYQAEYHLVTAFSGTDSVMVMDDLGKFKTAAVTVTLPGAPEALEVNGPDTMDESAAITLTATGGAPDYTWSVISGSTYAHLNSTSGNAVQLIGNNNVGIPPATQTVTVQVVDAASATVTKSITVNAVP